MSTFYANYPTAGEAAGSNPSVGVNTTTAPTSSTEIGFIDGSGNLQGVSPTNPLPVTIDGGLANPLNVNIADYGGAVTSLGQKLSAASMPVVLASDQSAIPVSQSGTWNLNNITGTISLPTGASTSALQTTGNTSLASILADMTNGTQVTTITGTVPLPTGAATSALQTTGNTSLASILADMTNGTQVTTITGTVPLPTGASTAALQSNVQSAPGTSQTVAITIQGNASGIPVPITGTISTTNSANGTPGTTPPAAATYIAGLTSTSSPSYTTGNLEPLSLTLAGAVRVDGSAVTQPVSGTLNTNSPINTNGSASNSTTVGSGSATTFTPPANAIGFILESESTNTINLRWAVGTTATTTVGILMEPGRDTGFVPAKATVSVIALSGSGQAVGIQWIMSS
jgi:hypothetical protein